MGESNIMGKDIKILVCAHKEARLPRHEYFYPIQVGAALSTNIFLPVQDNSGEDHISNKNPPLLRTDCALLGMEEPAI